MDKDWIIEKAKAEAGQEIGAGALARDPDLCSDCPPDEYPTDKTRCSPCPRRNFRERSDDA